jgi:alkaline phosphatase D
MTHSLQTDRRRLILQASALAGAALTPAAWTSAVAQARLPEDPFRLGVASGEPEPDGVVLWTRLAPRPTEPGFGMGSAPVRVGWEIAEDESLKRVVRRGRTLAVAEAGHSVHVEVQGLEPDRWYWYRFVAGGYSSPVARTRTAPLPGATPDRLKLAFASCQKWEDGYYAAHAGIAADAPDLVLFLGDYIYERKPSDRALRRHPEGEAADLAGYRLRHAWYKADPDLQAAHAAAPWLVTWDDHEVANDYGGDAAGAESGPAFLARRAAAYQVYYENMPLRRRSRPVGPAMSLYRSLGWGDLAALDMLDTRQYRPAPTCLAEIDPKDSKRIPANCAERDAPARSLLGATQEAWLHRRLRSSRARWNLMGQQYLMGPLGLDKGQVSNDGWDGYVQTRRRLMETWRDHRVSNPVVLGGDIHTFFAGDLALKHGDRPVATEFVGGSISSKGIENRNLGPLRFFNPHLKYAEGETRGYGLIEVGRDAARIAFRGVADATVRGSPVRDIAAFAIASGEAGVKPA